LHPLLLEELRRIEAERLGHQMHEVRVQPGPTAVQSTPGVPTRPRALPDDFWQLPHRRRTTSSVAG
jgi:hypothetical protein